MNDIGGVWRTIAGRKVFIKDGQSLDEAMKESGKFAKKKNLKIKNNQKDIIKKQDKIRKPENITLEELNETKELSNKKDKNGFKQGVEKAVLDKYGCNSKFPELLEKDNYDKFEGKEIFKGIGADSKEKADKYLNDLVKGDIYVGNNNSGTGVWFADNIGTAENYASGGGGTTIKNGSNSFVVYAKISSDAKIINAADLPTRLERMKMYKTENDNILSKIVRDDGLYAAMLGYDILETNVGFNKDNPRHNYSILNRDVIKVRK